LYERECSVQRRFQKVIEEAPAMNIDSELKESLWSAAVAAGRAVDYRGAGTVEFIVDPNGVFAFLEMNTRLQVEHPVTELTTGVDLVRLQIEIAANEPLGQQSDMPHRAGHAIEARLNAEMPADGYRPSTGTVHTFSVPEGVRVDSGIVDGASITHHYDPMVAKIISYASTRDEAAQKLARALVGSRIHGVATNRDLLVRVLRDTRFLTGGVDTHFLEREADSLTAPLADEAGIRILAAVAALAIQARNREQSVALSSIPSGWRNVPFQLQALTLLHNGDEFEIAYRFSRDAVEVVVGEIDVGVDKMYCATPHMVDIAVGGVRMTYSVHIVDDEVFVDGTFASARFEIAARFPESGSAVSAGQMVAATPGVVVAAPVSAGDVVREGDTVMVIEAMKMEQAVAASSSGAVVAVFFAIGDQVDAGSVLVEIAREDQDG
jgi:propionyl-CoA carboxylase alpha chain